MAWVRQMAEIITVEDTLSTQVYARVDVRVAQRVDLQLDARLREHWNELFNARKREGFICNRQCSWKDFHFYGEKTMVSQSKRYMNMRTYLCPSQRH